MSRRSARFGVISAAALLPAVLFLNGCSAPVEAEAKATPVPSAAPTEYIPASADGPAQNVPKPQSYDELQEFSEEGMLKGAEAWLDTLYYLVETGDSSFLQSLSIDSCEMCLHAYETFGAIYADGGWIESAAPYEFDFLLTDFTVDDPTNYIAVLLSVPPETEYAKGGKIIEETTYTETEVAPMELSMIFDEQEHRWKMAEMQHAVSDDW